MALTYQYMSWEAATNETWRVRVRGALLHLVVNTKVKAAPSGNSEIAEDALGRLILADQGTWADKFSLPCAITQIGETSLESVTDGALFSAVNAVFPQFLTEPVAP